MLSLRGSFTAGGHSMSMCRCPGPACGILRSNARSGCPGIPDDAGHGRGAQHRLGKQVSSAERWSVDSSICGSPLVSFYTAGDFEETVLLRGLHLETKI